MTDSKSQGFQLDSFDHIGHVVKDCDATIESWTKLLGASNWTTREGGPLKLAWCQLGEAKVELLQPVPGTKSLWADFLESNGEGLHHICVRVPDIDKAIASLVEQGGEVMISTPGVFAYVNIGGPGSVIVELLKTPA
ncbi:MAG TPA: hypothetical protein G4O07_00650 [Dehalococcoidia bacterium]|nr:hypothetical protein [Dehalococcoidia bacterium]